MHNLINLAGVSSSLFLCAYMSTWETYIIACMVQPDKICKSTEDLSSLGFIEMQLALRMYVPWKYSLSKRTVNEWKNCRLIVCILVVLLCLKEQLVCSSSGFPCVGVRLIYWSLRSTATFVICFNWSLLLAFSLHFLPPLPFSDLSSHNPPILAVVFPVFWNLLTFLSRLFSVVYHLSFGPLLFHYNYLVRAGYT